MGWRTTSRSASFPSKLENVLFQVLYTVTLIGSVVLPVAGSWLAANWARDRVLDDRGFVPAAVIVGVYLVVGPIADHLLDGLVLWSTIVGHLVEVGLLLGLTAVGVGSIFGWTLRAALRQLQGVGAMTSRPCWTTSR